MSEELTDMPIWQNHEQRITTLEVTTANIQGEFREVKDIINEGNKEQAERLARIDKTLMDEFFKKRKDTRDNMWKLIFKVSGAVVGGGSFIYVIIEKLTGG